MGTAGREAVDLAAKAGLFLYPWQQHVLERMLGERSDGKWAAFEACLIVPRQNGKTVLLLARALAGLLLFDERLILWSSQLDSTNLESFRALKELIEANDFLNLRIRAVRETNGQVTVEFKGGQRVRFVCRSSHGGRGFTADCVIFDEAYKLETAIMGALTPTLLNRPNPQMWYTSSAPRADSAQLWAVRRRGMSGVDADRLAFLEWSVDPDAFDADDPVSWAQANPTMGTGFLVAENMRAVHDSMPRAEFIREICGVPDPEASAAGDLALSLEAWSASFDGRSAIDGVPTIALDVSDRGKAAVAVAGVRADGLIHVEIPIYEDDDATIVDRVVGMCERAGAQLVVAAHGNAESHLPELRESGVALVELKAHEVNAACVRFARSVKDGKIRHLGTGVLNAAVATAVKQPVGDAFKFKRRVADLSPDLSPLYAAVLASWPQEAAPVKSIVSFSG